MVYDKFKIFASCYFHPGFQGRFLPTHMAWDFPKQAQRPNANKIARYYYLSIICVVCFLIEAAFVYTEVAAASDKKNH